MGYGRHSLHSSQAEPVVVVWMGDHRVGDRHTDEVACLLQQFRPLLRCRPAVDQRGAFLAGNQPSGDAVGLQDADVYGGGHGLPRADRRLAHGPRLQRRNVLRGCSTLALARFECQ